MTHYEHLRKHFVQVLNLHPDSPETVGQCFVLATTLPRSYRCQTLAIMGSHMADFIERQRDGSEK